MESVGIAQSIRLLDYCSVLQTETVVTQAAAIIIVDGGEEKRNVNIRSDSQAAINALSYNIINSKTMYD